jgi:hypothetical protein
MPPTEAASSDEAAIGQPVYYSTLFALNLGLREAL